MKRLLSLAAAALLLLALPIFGATTETTLQSAATSVGVGSTLTTDGYSVGILTINCAGCVGTTINFEATADGTNYVAVLAIQVGTTNMATSTSTAGVSVWETPVSGLQQLRANVTSYSAGTITVTGHGSAVPWNSKVVSANIVGGSLSVVASAAPRGLPPSVPFGVAANPLLYRAAMAQFCSQNLCAQTQLGK